MSPFANLVLLTDRGAAEAARASPVSDRPELPGYCCVQAPTAIPNYGRQRSCTLSNARGKLLALMRPLDMIRKLCDRYTGSTTV